MVYIGCRSRRALDSGGVIVAAVVGIAIAKSPEGGNIGFIIPCSDEYEDYLSQGRLRQER